MDVTDGLPWGLTRMTDRLPESPPLYARAELDPLTQTGRFFDAQGQPIDMGAHGTNKEWSTASKSGGGGDGQGPPKPQTDDDSNRDSGPD
jgi:putative ATP-grasp target RiPP